MGKKEHTLPEKILGLCFYSDVMNQHKKGPIPSTFTVPIQLKYSPKGINVEAALVRDAAHAPIVINWKKYPTSNGTEIPNNRRHRKAHTLSDHHLVTGSPDLSSGPHQISCFNQHADPFLTCSK